MSQDTRSVRVVSRLRSLFRGWSSKLPWAKVAPAWDGLDITDALNGPVEDLAASVDLNLEPMHHSRTWRIGKVNRKLRDLYGFLRSIIWHRHDIRWVLTPEDRRELVALLSLIHISEPTRPY